MMKTAVVLVLLAVAEAQQIHRDCGRFVNIHFNSNIYTTKEVNERVSFQKGSTATLHWVSIPGCTSSPCTVKKGTDVEATFNYTASNYLYKETIFILNEVSSILTTSCYDFQLRIAMN